MGSRPTLLLCGSESHPLYPALFAAGVRAAATGLAFERADVDDLPGEPALVLVARDDRRPIRYLAAPEGPEEAPFEEALAALEGAASVDVDLQRKLEALEDPADIRVYISAACPHCPHVVRTALQVTLASSRVTTTVVDASYFAELAEAHGARSVPLTVIDGGFSVTGQLTAEELATHILARGEDAFELRSFMSLIEAGRFADAAAAVVAGPGLARFLEAWRRSTLSSRMGLMLLAEQTIEDTPQALHPAVADLCALAQSGEADDALRGDTVDLLGKIGHRDAIPTLQILAKDPHPDIAEVAADVLEDLRE